MKTLSFYRGRKEEILAGETYFFGQLWDGNGDGEELLESGAIGVWNEAENDFGVVDFEIVESNEDILETLVRVK